MHRPQICYHTRPNAQSRSSKDSCKKSTNAQIDDTVGEPCTEGEEREDGHTGKIDCSTAKSFA